MLIDKDSNNPKLCAICGNTPVESFNAKWLQVFKCGNPKCGHIYASGQSDYHGVQKHPDTFSEYLRYQDRNRRLVKFWQQRRFLSSDSVVLDFGAGAGHIAKAIREITGTKEITCVEADIESQIALRKDGFHVVERLEQCSNDFDAVLLVEVIEHIDSPIGLLRAIKAHMRPGRRIFLSTPCGETRSGSRATNAYDTPEHVHFFTEGSLKLAIKKAGFSELEFLRVPELYPRERGAIGFSTAYIKESVRVLRDWFRGYSHLVVFVS